MIIHAALKLPRFVALSRAAVNHSMPHYRIALNFRGSLLSRIFNCSRKYFNEIFDTRRAVCACSEFVKLFLRNLQKVLVKCRRNVANKLFISRYFNPVLRSARTSLCTCNKLIALTAKLFLSVEVQNLHT